MEKVLHLVVLFLLFKPVILEEGNHRILTSILSNINCIKDTRYIVYTA